MTELLNSRELAKRLRISEYALRRLVRTGKVPVVKCGPKSWRYDLANVLQQLQQGGVK
ncbi:MAG: helix-turn-helix domain-containing protein [Phycisphaerae bacterium]